jgi:hypothetical protein
MSARVESTRIAFDDLLEEESILTNNCLQGDGKSCETYFYNYNDHQFQGSQF